jgi:hypothetical protein
MPIFDPSFYSQVMTQVSHGFADTLIVGGHILWEVVDVFKGELEEKEGICSIYQTVCARERAVNVS